MQPFSEEEMSEMLRVCDPRGTGIVSMQRFRSLPCWRTEALLEEEGFVVSGADSHEDTVALPDVIPDGLLSDSEGTSQCAADPSHAAGVRQRMEHYCSAARGRMSEGGRGWVSGSMIAAREWLYRKIPAGGGGGGGFVVNATRAADGATVATPQRSFES